MIDMLWFNEVEYKVLVIDFFWIVDDYQKMVYLCLKVGVYNELVE